MWFAHEYKIQIKAADAAAAVRVAAGANSINPPLDYYEALVWDGLPRAGKWLTTYMGCEDTAYNNHVGRWWLISGVARSYQPGCQVDHTLILEGKQGRGKSQALRALAGDGWFTDDLEDFTKKDAVQQLCGKKIVELSELDNLRKADVAEIKATSVCRTPGILSRCHVSVFLRARRTMRSTSETKPETGVSGQ
jgi:predicted P-loop ATPase